jgi:arginyl-tRNA synthetase
LLYAGARLSSIQRNAAAKGFDSEAFVAAGATVSLEQPAELELGLALARFGERRARTSPTPPPHP